MCQIWGRIWILEGHFFSPRAWRLICCPRFLWFTRPAQMPSSGLLLFTWFVRIIHASVFSKQWAHWGQGASLIPVILVLQVRHIWCSQLYLLHSLGHRVYPGCCLFLCGFVAGFASGPPSTSSQPMVEFQEAATPHLSPLCFPAGQCPTRRFSSQWSVNNSGMCLLWDHNGAWPEKACSYYYNHNNLYSKELGIEGKGLNKKARRQRKEESKTWNPFKNLLCETSSVVQ